LKKANGIRSETQTQAKRA